MISSTGAQGPTGARPQFDTHVQPPRYLTHDIPGTGGVIKQRPTDFLVEELPAYDLSGEGEHVYLFVEKTNVSTLHMVRLLARHFGVATGAVGFAGLKDRLGVTRQLVSVHVPGKKPEDFPAFAHEGIAILWVDRHSNKLRRGHLKGNQFIIRIRDVDPGRVVHAHRTLRVLTQHGAPNRIGYQRFGLLQRNHEIGRAIILRDYQGVLDALLGLPAAPAWCPDSQRAARDHYAHGRFVEALEAMPRSMHSERRALSSLARGRSIKNAAHTIERAELGFFVTAFQSAVFNAVLDARIIAGTYQQLLEGDLAFKHDSGAVFPITPEALSPELAARALALDISPSGPMWGPRVTRASGIPGAIELDALTNSGLALCDLDRIDALGTDSIEGKRRPLRVPIAYPEVEGGRDEHGDYIKVRFELPRGAFATSVLQEIMKVPDLEGPRTNLSDEEPEELEA